MIELAWRFAVTVHIQMASHLYKVECWWEKDQQTRLCAEQGLGGIV